MWGIPSEAAEGHEAMQKIMAAGCGDARVSLFDAWPSRRAALIAGAGAAALGLDLLVQEGDAQAAGREFHGAWPYEVRPAGTYNSFVTDGSAIVFSSIYADLLEMPLAMYYTADKRWLWLLATGGLFDGNNYVVTLRKGARWSDGSAFTAQDVLDAWTILRVLGNPLFDYVDTIAAPDDYTVAFHMKVPSILVERYVLHQWTVGGPRAHTVYGGWAQRFRALLSAGTAIDAPAVQALQSTFLKFSPARTVVNGPFQIDQGSITQKKLTLAANPTSWAHGLVRFDKIVLYNGNTTTVTPIVLAGQVDYLTHGFPPATIRAFQARGDTIVRPPLYYGAGILPNQARLPVLRNKAARQAPATRGGPPAQWSGGRGSVGHRRPVCGRLQRYTGARLAGQSHRGQAEHVPLRSGASGGAAGERRLEEGCRRPVAHARRSRGCLGAADAGGVA
jgi:peptide/nickel transport system substrate-binding protein